MECPEEWTYCVQDVELSKAASITKLDNFKADNFTLIYVPGFNESSDSQSTRTIVQALLEKGGFNVIVVDWRAISLGNLVTAALAAHSLGLELAGAIDQMSECGLQLKCLSLVGHTIGAHVAAYAGKYSCNCIPRLTALDPVGVGTNWLGVDRLRLVPDDAQFVDAIHTHGGRYGMHYSVAHADFYPNAGRSLKPGCPSKLLPDHFSPDASPHHWTSWQFYAESITRSPECFLSRQTCSWAEFKTNCPTTNCSPMGYHVKKTASGDYYLQTNLVAPFGRGKKGTRYDPALEKGPCPSENKDDDKCGKKKEEPKKEDKCEPEAPPLCLDCSPPKVEECPAPPPKKEKAKEPDCSQPKKQQICEPPKKKKKRERACAV